jgi:hypothetical protein
MAGLNYGNLRAWSMLHNKHYICFLSKVNTGIFDYEQGRQNITDPGGVVYDPTSIIYVINMQTGALGFWSNVSVRGYTAPPGQLVSTRDAYYVVEDSTTNGPIICSAEALFQEAGSSGQVQDSTTTNPRVAAFSPHFYVEGGLHSFGDPERSKRLQMVLARYSLYGSSDTSKLGIDLVEDMGTKTKAVSPKARTSTDVANPVSWVNKRARFSTRSGLVGVRFYTMADGFPSAARLGPWSIGLKVQRPGRL